MSSTPLFSPEERVSQDPPVSALPENLKGKSPEEVAQFYQQRETHLQLQLNEAQRRPAQPAVEPVRPVAPSSADFWSDPAKAVEAAIRAGAPDRNEFDRASAFVQTNMVEVAKLITHQKHSDFDKFSGEIQTLINRCDPWMRADFNTWETAYNYIRGSHVDQLVSDATARATMGAEPVNPSSVEPAKPRVVTAEEKYVCERLGISDDQYNTAVNNMAASRWPLTMSNTRGA